MKIGNGQMAMAAIFAAAVLPAQTPADPRAAMNAALTQQRAAASAIEESLARQRSSIETLALLSVAGGAILLVEFGKLHHPIGPWFGRAGLAWSAASGEGEHHAARQNESDSRSCCRGSAHRRPSSLPIFASVCKPARVAKESA